MKNKRLFTLIACCIINLCLGSIYSWSVFASSMSVYLTNLLQTEITSADLALVYTVANSVGPITMITSGWFNDHFGPKKVIIVGGTMFGLGMFLSGFATSVGFLVVSYGLVSGLGLGMAYGCTISTVVKLFPDKRGLVGGIATAVYGLSAVIVSPLATLIVEKTSATTSFKILGLAFIFLILLCTFFVTTPEKERKISTKVVVEASGSEKTWREMLQTKTFYVMILLLVCGAFPGMMIISQASGIAQGMAGMNALAASTAVSVLALFNSSGRIMAGSLSDKIGRIYTLMFSCICSVFGLAILFFFGGKSVIAFYFGIAIIGICFGAFMGIFPGFTADQFGAKNNSVNYGIMFIGFALAGFFGPTVMRLVLEKTGNYQQAFILAIVSNILGLVMGAVYLTLNKKFVKAKS